MILIGQYDSPFARRVAIALRTYGHDYAHRPWSTFGDGDRIAQFNPLRRVPTLVLDDETVLIESGAILDWLDEQAGPGRAMIAVAGPTRREALHVIALATGLCDKMVSLVYERILHEQLSEVWMTRCRTQIGAVVEVLEAACGALATPWWFGEAPGHADVAVACAMRFLGEAHPAIDAKGKWPALRAHAARSEARGEFAAVMQPFVPPAG